MEQQKLSCNVMVEGSVLQCPAKLALGTENGELAFYGILRWGEKKLSDTLGVVDNDLSERFGGYVDKLLPDCLPGELSISYRKQLTVIGIQDSNVYFKLGKAGSDIALLFAYYLPEKAEDEENKTSALLRAVNEAADFFGIKEFLFYAHKGGQWLLPQLQADDSAYASVPVEIKKCSFMTCAYISMDGNSVFQKAVRELFGLRKTELYIGGGKEGFTSILTMPAFQTPLLEGKDMYMLMEISKTPTFIIKGSFRFSYIPDILFTVDCGVSSNAFLLEAVAEVNKPVSLIGPFSIGNTCLMIRFVAGGVSFGMYTNLFIREIQLFGALMLRVQCNTVMLDLLSAAVSDLSIPILLKNLLGTDVQGIEALDFIRIMGLPFQNMDSFGEEAVQKRDLPAIVSQFNSAVTDTTLRLNTEEVQITPFQGGLNLTDRKRMRQYYIDASGNLKLMAQFYYSAVNTRLGSYTVERGLFICGRIEIFQFAFEALFSYREAEGLLAYAKIREIDLGFLKIGPSQIGQGSAETLPLAKDSVLWQFLNPAERGVVFFLSVGKKDISFYFDGRVEFLSLLSADARIIFTKGWISVDLRTDLLSIFRVSLHIGVRYQDFSSGGFDFSLEIDTSGLTEKLQAVTRNIENAIQKLRNKINNAKREIDRAQAHVNELYGQIQELDRKIEGCKQEIRNASWWKKVFVAIGKGIEIGAYEVAKVGVYAAIGVATAALQVAKAVVDLSGKVGEGVMKAVNAVIQGAMSLFYIQYIKLEAKASVQEQSFHAEIKFVALGKSYDLQKTIGKGALQGNAANATNALSGCINGELQHDLDHIEDGAMRSNWQRYRHENYTVEQQCRRLDGAKEHLNSSVALLQSIQNIYVEEFQTPMEDFDAMNVSLVGALDDAENVLTAGMQAGDVSVLSQSMGGLKRSVSYREKQGVYRDEELAETKKLIAEYDKARLLYDKVTAGVKDVQKQRKSMEKHREAVQRETRQTCGECIMRQEQGDMSHVLRQVEEQMYESFPVDRSGADFINLSREPLIQQCFREAEREEGAEPSPKIQRLRNRSRKGQYNSRL